MKSDRDRLARQDFFLPKEWLSVRSALFGAWLNQSRYQECTPTRAQTGSLALGVIFIIIFNYLLPRAVSIVRSRANMTRGSADQECALRGRHPIPCIHCMTGDGDRCVTQTYTDAYKRWMRQCRVRSSEASDETERGGAASGRGTRVLRWSGRLGGWATSRAALEDVEMEVIE